MCIGDNFLMAFDDIRAWWGIILAGISGSTLAGVTIKKVNDHDKIIFKEKGGLNIVDSETCAYNRQQCRKYIISEISTILDEKLKKYNKQQETETIISEIRALRKKMEENR